MTSAKNVYEIIEAQQEQNVVAKEKTQEQVFQKELLEETKDPIKMGRNEYLRTCSLCHGVDGKGHGVYAFELKSAPQDLTKIKKENNGVFPFSHLYQIIDGRSDVKSHGTREMPIWGNRYNSESWLYTSERNSETFVRGQIFELLLYLETIQE